MGVLLDMSTRLDSSDGCCHQDVINLIVDKLISLPEIVQPLMSLVDTLTSKYDKIFLQAYYSLRNNHACM